MGALYTGKNPLPRDYPRNTMHKVNRSLAAHQPRRQQVAGSAEAKILPSEDGDHRKHRRESIFKLLQ